MGPLLQISQRCAITKTPLKIKGNYSIGHPGSGHSLCATMTPHSRHGSPSVKSIYAVVTLAALLLTASCGSESKASGDIVARVNGKEITMAELERQFQMRASSDQAPSQEEM